MADQEDLKVEEGAQSAGEAKDEGAQIADEGKGGGVTDDVPALDLLGVAPQAADKKPKEVWDEGDLKLVSAVDEYITMFGSKIEDGFKFTVQQRDSIKKVIARLQAYDGVIFKAYMGAGKTYMSVAIMYYIRARAQGDEKSITIVCPNGLKSQWEDRWKVSVANLDFWEMKDFIDHAKNGNYEDQRYFIFDECHKIRIETLTLNDKEAENVCTFLSKNGIKRLGLTGTLIYYDRDDLLYEVNSFVGPDHEGRWPLPFTWTHLTNVFRDTQGDTYGFYYTLKSIFGGWIFNLERLQLYPIPNFLDLADIGDFYLNQYGPYKEPKRAAVSDLMRRIPGFDADVLTPNLANLVIKGPMTVLSIMSYTTMMNPFSYLIPTIFTMVQIENQNALNDLDKELIQGKICDVIVDMPNIDVDERTSLASNLIKKVDWLAHAPEFAVSKRTSAARTASNLFGSRTPTLLQTWADDKTTPHILCREIVYKWPAIEQLYDRKGVKSQGIDPKSVFITLCHRFEEVDFDWYQLQMFVRFTNNRMTKMDAKLLGIPESKRTMTRQLTMHDLETTGLKIGSVQFSEGINAEIEKGVKERSNQFRNSFKSLEKKTASEEAPQSGELKNDYKGEMFNVNKFDKAISRMVEPTVRRVVVFSQFEDVLTNFRTYAGERHDNFKFYTHNELHPFNFDARTDQDNNISKYIMTLSAAQADGYDGLQDVDLMIILEPCATDSMKRQLIARIVRQRAHTQSRRVVVFEYMCTPGFGNISRIEASMMDWWQHDKRVAYWVFEPLLDNTRTPDQVVVRGQQVSGEMENLCSGAEEGEEFKKGLHNKVKKALKGDRREKVREAVYGKYNLEILAHERGVIRSKQPKTYADRLQYARMSSILKSRLDKLVENKNAADQAEIENIKNELAKDKPAVALKPS